MRAPELDVRRDHGPVTEPVQLDLEGSTLTVQRIPDPADPSTYPEAVINCQGEHSAARVSQGPAATSCATGSDWRCFPPFNIARPPNAASAKSTRRVAA
jgi:hypothetical protein